MTRYYKSLLYINLPCFPSFGVMYACSTFINLLDLQRNFKLFSGNLSNSGSEVFGEGSSSKNMYVPKGFSKVPEIYYTFEINCIIKSNCNNTKLRTHYLTIFITLDFGLRSHFMNLLVYVFFNETNF